MKYLAMALMAALTIVTLIGLLPEAHAGGTQCYTYQGQRICCHTYGTTTNCY
jgi:hypothetical protein